MNFIEELRNLSTKIEEQKGIVENEEQTKAAFIDPFILKVLGYDIFDPLEVVREAKGGTGTKQGEKADYAIKKDDEVIMIIECKKCGADLTDAHTKQLYRYFSFAHARIAVLTNGVLYQFYTDLEKPNLMDTKPFLEFDMLDIQQQLVQQPLVNELKRFTKSAFDLESILAAARDLKYTNEIKRTVIKHLKPPSEDFVKFLLSRLDIKGQKQSEEIQEFTDIVTRVLNHVFDPDPPPPNVPLYVTMQDGTVIAEKEAVDTFIKTIEKLGVDEAAKTAKEHKIFAHKGRNVYLISDDKDSEGLPQRKLGAYWIATRSSSPDKKRILDQIAAGLGVEMTVIATPKPRH